MNATNNIINLIQLMTVGSTQQQYSDNLIYDNQAFSYFVSALFILGALILGLKIISMLTSLYNTKSWLRRLSKLSVYRQKAILFTEENKCGFCNAKIIGSFILFILCMVVPYIVLSQSQQSNRLSGFDPYEILNVSINANLTEIKKAFRKSALIYHPDSKRDNSEYNKFILKVKAYQCLTDPEGKQNCFKYGSPDGEISHKMGIGLPSFLLNPQYLPYVLSVLLPIILVIPFVIFYFIKSTQSPKYHIQNKICFSLMIPAFNEIDFCVVGGCTKQLQNITKFCVLPQSQYENLKTELRNESHLKQNLISQLSQKHLCSIKILLDFMRDKNMKINTELLKIIPTICKDVLQKSFKISVKRKKICRSKKGQWYGLIPSRKVLTYCWQLYNLTTQPTLTSILSFSQLNQSEKSALHEYKNANIHELISDEMKKKEFVEFFSEKNRNLLSEQLTLLPQISISSKITVENEEVKQIYQGDIAFIEVSVKNINLSPGFILSPNYTRLQREQFVLVVSHNSHLYSYLFFHFQGNNRQVIHKFEIKKFLLKEGTCKLNMQVWSVNYINFNLCHTTTIEILKKLKNKPIIVHEQDKMVQKMDKNFYEKFVQLNKPSESDLQLSDSEENNQDINLKKRKKGKKEEKSKKQVLSKIKIRQKYSKYGVVKERSRVG